MEARRAGWPAPRAAAAAPSRPGMPRRAALRASLRPRCIIRSAKPRAASTYVTSLSTSSAWSGVLVRDLADDAGLAAGRVERDHRRRGHRPLPERVEAAAVEARAVVLDVIGVGQLVPEARRLVRLHRRAAGPLDEQPAEPQRLVADHLGRQPEPRPARQQPVLGIALERFARDARRLPVGRAGDDQPEQAP